MRIYLVQHGQAKSEEQDPDRPLTQNGEADVRKIASFLKNTGICVDIIWHSGKTRALQTAEILAESIVSNQGVVQHKGLSPNDDIIRIKDELLLSGMDLMIVGHLPFLSKLATLLVTGNESADLATFQQGGLICLEKGEDQACTVRWMIIPDLLKQ